VIADGHPYRTLQAALLQCLEEGSPPSGSGGHVNLSPKGHGDTFTILDGRTVAYLDLTGSGAETVAHLRDNGRITLVLCAFSGPPRILRLYGQGRIVLPRDDRWEDLASRLPARRGARTVVVMGSSASPTPAATPSRSTTTPAIVTCSTHRPAPVRRNATEPQPNRSRPPS
jgi:hypothetical protein